MNKQGHSHPGTGDRLAGLLRRLRSLARHSPEPADNRQADKPSGLNHRVRLQDEATDRTKPTHQPPNAAGRILIVELDGWICGSLPSLLGQGGYEARVVRGEEAALDVLKREPSVLLIVGGRADPDFYRAVCRALSAPILALVPKGDEEQALSAFAAGVDQYQTGIVSSAEVAARARAMLRRAAWPAPTSPEGKAE
jgi:PleD family two-component response regulator